MSYLDELRESPDTFREARKKKSASYLMFMLYTEEDKEGQDSLFCFFEGKDNDYYVSTITKYTDEYYTIPCGGRDKVLELYQLITSKDEYNKYKKAFFIDRDFNEPLPPRNPPIFETPYYSIENFYVSVDVFKKIIINKFPQLVVAKGKGFEVYIKLFTARQKEFHQAVTLFNAWYACLIKIRNTTGQQTGVNLKDKLPNWVLDFSLEEVSAKYNLETIKDNFDKALEVPEEDLNAKLDEFKNCEQYQVFRGKYEMEFLVRFIELILKDSTTTKKYIQTKINFDFSQRLSNQQAITIFSGYAETPDSLHDYLMQVTQ